MLPIFFENAIEFRKWLEKNHKSETELLVGFYKVSTGKPTMTWSESVDQALCFGWIDGVRKSLDKDSYTIRFTPRKTTSIWSVVNIKKIEELTKNNLMQEAGITAFEKRKEEKSKVYSFESEAKELSEPLEKIFKKELNAWTFFNEQAPFYKKAIIHWIVTAKQEKTQLSRLEKVIQASKEQKRIK